MGIEDMAKKMVETLKDKSKDKESKKEATKGKETKDTLRGFRAELSDLQKTLLSDTDLKYASQVDDRIKFFLDKPENQVPDQNELAMLGQEISKSLEDEKFRQHLIDLEKK